MTLESRAVLAESVKLFDGKVPRMRHGGVEHRCSMAVAQQEYVAIFPSGVRGIVLEDAETKRGEDVRHSELTGTVAAARFLEHSDDRATDQHRLVV